MIGANARQGIKKSNLKSNQETNQSVAKQSQEERKQQTIQSLMAKMSLEDKVGQLFFARVPAQNALADLEDYRLGAYLLFARDYADKDLTGVKEMTTSFQEVSKIPLIIGSDEEGGTVTRISEILDNPFQSPMALYQVGGLAGVLADNKAKVELLKSVGIYTGLYPVADIAQRSSSFIYSRTLGEDLTKTSDYVSQVVRQLKKEKFGSTLKHFPGYGDNGDSHTGVIQDDRSLSQLAAYDLRVFEAGIKAGADSVLVSHNILSQIDDVPASISPKMTQILRRDLGFQGVIMTDDFDMAGLANLMSQEEAAYQAIQAGNDMVMSSSYQTQIPYLLEKVKSGQLSEERLEESVKRILAWKYELGLLSDKAE
ncbi:glycoside hydrolase family 3 protein [Streptococcus cuniculipharyngis]|nr:glycoside hydrolase family 3 N-terminal domain-containing protein [Streptococcus cuniculipharyngis]